MLVDAITAANIDTATGGCPAGRGADTIVLPARSTQTLTAVNNDTYGLTSSSVKPRRERRSFTNGRPKPQRLLACNCLFCTSTKDPCILPMLSA